MYSIKNFERPSVAADSVVFGIDSTDGVSRKNLKNHLLKILLVRRGEEPFLEKLSLAGGFLRKDETIEQAAERELKEEAGVSGAKLINFAVYSKPDRDPRGWIVSCAFLALCKTVNLCTDKDSDAKNAQWFNFEYSCSENKEKIRLYSDDEDIILEYRDGKALENPLAFDHAQIIRDGFLRLRDETIHHDIIFELMPQLFTVSDLQQPYEAITGITSSPQNFRKKMSSKIEETDTYSSEKMAHRPSKLYKKIKED